MQYCMTIIGSFCVGFYTCMYTIQSFNWRKTCLNYCSPRFLSCCCCSTLDFILGMYLYELHTWVGPWEKVSENIDHPYCAIFVTNLSQWIGFDGFWPFLTSPDPWGGLGGPGGVWGGLLNPKLLLLFGDQFQPWNTMFWVKTTCNTMFLRFWVKWSPPG